MEKQKSHELEEVFLQLKKMMTDMKFGSITLVVQNGQVIQIEKNEKHRLK